jgi:pimeloyl-ACP methyl ester carboxylesterase
MTIDREQRPFVREVGAGDGVVCLHSSGASSAQWRALMEQLGGDFHVLAADLYGSGRSPAWRHRRALSLGDEVALLEPVFASAGDRFHLIGHSYGGAVALKAALLHPERIESLVLIEPVLFALLVADDPEQPAAREIAAVRDATLAAVAQGNLARAAELFVDYWASPGAWAGTPDGRRTAIANAMLKVTSEWDALFTEPTPLATFATLAVDTTLIVGAESPASSKSVARLLARTLPRVTPVELAGVGHMAPVTHPDAVHAVIATHLGARCSRYRGTVRPSARTGT